MHYAAFFNVNSFFCSPPYVEAETFPLKYGLIKFVTDAMILFPNAGVPVSDQPLSDIMLYRSYSKFVQRFIVSPPDPDPAAPDSGHQTPHLVHQEAVGIQAGAGIHPVVAETGSSGEDRQEVGTTFLVAEEACLVRRGRVALAFRGRLVAGSCLVGDR